jgi:valyl-tRNA synthetase
MDEKLLKPYDPQNTEKRIYKLWEESGFFNPDVCAEKGVIKPDAKPFTIIMPPVNANGSLHAGHGLVIAIEDIMVRYKRMRGFKTLWLPGLDHAGFETQVVYEKKLEKEGRSRFGMDPKKLYEEILDFTLTNSSHIKSQIKKMGASCDWSREKFTLDDDVVKTVYQTFKRMYADDLIYRGNRIVSWCSKHQTSFSDLEIKDEERVSKLYTFKYNKDFPISISSTRPETKVGDTAVAVNPDDSRYKEFVGKEYDLEFCGVPIHIKIIADKEVDPAFGTGALGVTPAHSKIDFEMAERHDLPRKQVINEYGKMIVGGENLLGKKVAEAREVIAEWLKNEGLLEKVDENYKQVVPTCYKCGTVIEPLIKNQWFVKMKPLAEKALEKIEADEIKYIPEHYKKITTYWLENIMDWNISRQIVWGIPIPAKICKKCGHGMADVENKISECAKCGGEVEQDKDTFDTWFSSGQWPFIATGYPNGNDFKTFYPTDVMETAGEIIFFWVSRMIMLGLYVTGEIPFKNVYLHGLVLDAKGLKMSKSKGNVIDPLTLTDQFGTDAFRIGMVVGNTPGTSLALSPDKIRGYKNFANKIWNATRFVLENTKDFTVPENPEYDEEDKKSNEELKALLQEITKEMDEYKFYIVAEKLYHYFWHTFADVIIERSKKKIIESEKTGANTDSARALLYTQLTTLLRALHPFIPFVTEEIWSMLPMKDKNLLMIEKWPS